MILALRSNPKSKPNKDPWPSYEIIVKCTSVQDVESCAEVPVPSKSNDLCGRTSRDSVKYPHKISSEDSVESREESPLLPEARPKVDDLTFSTLSTGSTTLNKIEVNTQGTPLTRNLCLSAEKARKYFLMKPPFTGSVREEGPEQIGNYRENRCVERLPCVFRQTPLKFAEDFTQKFLEEFRRFEKTILSKIDDIKTDAEILRANISIQTSRRDVCPIEIPIGNDLSLQVAEEILKS